MVVDTDFIAAYGSNGYSWNVTRSECDNLIFEHAKECGAKTFDGCKVHSLAFLSRDGKAVPPDFDVANPTKPVSAAWSHKDGSSGEISFDYLVDASGRFGLMSNKYLKNRHFNQGLKNVAFWAYWKGTGIYGNGTHEGGCPYFEHLQGTLTIKRMTFLHGLIVIFNRCERLGMVYSPAQRDDFCGYCHGP